MNTTKINSGLFVLITFSFLLPFLKISCSEQELAKLNGIELAFGTTVERQGVFGNPEKQKIESEPYALLAFLCGIAGIMFSFFRYNYQNKNPDVVFIIIGVLGGLFLYLLSVKLNDDANVKSLKIEFEIGYYLALIMYIAVMVLNSLPYIKDLKTNKN